MIKCAIFDLGGVYFEDGTKKFIKLLSEKLNRPYNDLYPLFREGKSIEYRENKISGNEFFQYASGKIENKISPEELNRLWVSQYTEISGVKDIILDLRKKGIKVFALSDNVPERIQYLQKKYSFKEVFDEVILSYEVKLSKKSPEIFLLALKKTQTLPEETVFIDDRQEVLDIATSIGLQTILFTTPKQLLVDLEMF